MSKLLVVEIPESESAHLTVLGFVMATRELPTAEELGRVAVTEKYHYAVMSSAASDGLTEYEWVGQAILECIRGKP